MTGNTTTGEKLRGLFLAALMVFSVFAGTVAFAGTAAAAGNATSVTAEAVDTTDANATANITVALEDSNTDTNVQIAIKDADSNTIALYNSTDTASNQDGLEAIYTVNGNKKVFEFNSTALPNGGNFVLGEGEVRADAGDNPDASSPDATTTIQLDGMDVSATDGARVAANDTEVEYTVNLENPGSQDRTQDVQFVVSDENDTIDPTDTGTYTVLDTEADVLVPASGSESVTFTNNTGDLPGANDNVNNYEIAGLTSGSPIGFSAADLVTGSGTEGSVTVSVVDDSSERQENVDVELWLETDYDTESLVLEEKETNVNGEVTFSGLAVGSDNNNPIRYTARAGANTDDLSSTTTTLSLYEPTQTSDSSTVVTERLVKPERIDVVQDKHNAVADGSDEITFTATVYGGVDGEVNPGDDDERPMANEEVRVVDNGDSITYTGNPGTNATGAQIYETNDEGEVSFSVSSDEVQTVDFTFEAGNGEGALSQTETKNFVLSGEGNLAGTVNNKHTTGPIEDASVWVVKQDDYETNEFVTSVSLPADEDDTIWLRLHDNETNQIIDNDEYDLRQAEGDDGTHVRKIAAMNESDNAEGQGYALIDADGDDQIQFNHTRLLDEEYYAQVSYDAENSSARTGVVDVGTEDFKNVTSVDTTQDNLVTNLGGNNPYVFSPAANLTLAATENLASTTGANYVDSPGFVNYYGYDTEGTTDDGRFVLNRLPTSFQDGAGYVAIATDTGFTTDFADVDVAEDGQLTFSEGQGSNELFLEPVPVEPDGVDIKQIGTRADMSAGLVPFADQSDSTYQEVPRDGDAVDVFTVNTTAKGDLVNATTTVDFADTNVQGEFVAIASGEFVSVDNSTNTATLYTGTDGQAEVWFQSDQDSNSVDTEKTAVLEADSSVTDSSNVRFVGVINSKSAEVSGIVTDSNNEPVPSVVWTAELTVGGTDFTVEPDAADLSQFEISRLDTNGNVVESATVNRSQIDTTGPGYNFNVDANGNQVFPGVSVDSSVDEGLTLVTDSTTGVQESSSYTLPRVPAVENPSTNNVAIRAASDASVANAGSVSDLQTGTAVTTATEVNRTSTANVEISGAQAANFVVSGLTATPDPATQGDTVTVEATIENQGAVTAATEVTYLVGADGEAETERDSTTTDPIVAGQDTTVTFTLDTSSLDAGDYIHYVLTDTGRQDTVDQTIESDSNGGSAWYEPYVDQNDVVDDDGINDAVADYLNNDLTDDEFNALVGSYLSGDVVALDA